MNISRAWAMPSPNTFSIKPIKELIVPYVQHANGVIIDPLCGSSPFASHCVTNDLNPDIPADFHMESLEFLKMWHDEGVYGVLWDPPYSVRQISECYNKYGLKVDARTTSARFWSVRKKEIARIVQPGGFVVSCGWNSGGIGKTLRFEHVEILLVAHGGAHNDTIVVVERKI